MQSNSLKPGLICTLLILCLITSAVVSVAAQDKYSVGLSASIPTRNFKSTDPGQGSFAKPGWAFSFEHMFRLDTWPKGFSLAAHLSYQNNDLDNLALQESYTQQLGMRTEVAESSYKPFLITGGPFFQLPVSGPFSIEFKTGIGIIFTNIDPFVITAYDEQGAVSFSELIGFETQPNFTFLLGLQFELQLSNHLTIGLFGDYSAARGQVKATAGSLGSVDKVVELSFLNTGLNLSVRF